MFGLTSRPVHRGGTRRRHQSLAEAVPQFMAELYEQIVAESNESNYDGMFPAEVLPHDHVTITARERGQLERQRSSQSSGYELYGTRHKRHNKHVTPTTVNTVRSFIGNVSKDDSPFTYSFHLSYYYLSMLRSPSV